MRRDPSFAQVRPEKTWALSDWPLPGTDSKYATAVDGVVEVLREHGPMTLDQLRTETRVQSIGQGASPMPSSAVVLRLSASERQALGLAFSPHCSRHRLIRQSLTG